MGSGPHLRIAPQNVDAARNGLAEPGWRIAGLKRGALLIPDEGGEPGHHGDARPAACSRSRDARSRSASRCNSTMRLRMKGETGCSSAKSTSASSEAANLVRVESELSSAARLMMSAELQGSWPSASAASNFARWARARTRASPRPSALPASRPVTRDREAGLIASNVAGLHRSGHRSRHGLCVAVGGPDRWAGGRRRRWPVDQGRGRS